MRFHEAIARPNLLVKIPATHAGVPAIEGPDRPRLRGVHGIRAIGSVSERLAHQAHCTALVVHEPTPD
jgi:nucleotide-binding universal stress UspA family protein